MRYSCTILLYFCSTTVSIHTQHNTHVKSNTYDFWNSCLLSHKLHTQKHKKSNHNYTQNKQEKPGRFTVIKRQHVLSLCMITNLANSPVLCAFMIKKKQVLSPPKRTELSIAIFIQATLTFRIAKI